MQTQICVLFSALCGKPVHDRFEVDERLILVLLRAAIVISTLLTFIFVKLWECSHPKI